MLNFAVISILDFDSQLPARTVTVKLKFLGSLLKAFFWSDLNFADDETCYLDQCENDPCNGRGCKSTWNGKKVGFICECKFQIFLLTRNNINSFNFICINCHIYQLFNKCIKYTRFVPFYEFWLLF